MKTIQTNIPSPAFPCQFSQPIETIAFFDIETTGLSPRTSSLYLIGAMYYDMSQKQWTLIQWFADDYRSEAGILTAFLEFLKPYQALYHFNGATFDVPYVLSKCEKHQIAPSRHCLNLLQNTAPPQMPPGDTAISIDLLKAIRPLKKKLQLASANQTALERWLGIHRQDPYNGGELIAVYAEYMQKKILRSPEAGRLEQVLLLHNHDDMAGMLDICSILAYHKSLHPMEPPAIQDIVLTENRLSISFLLPSPVPKPVSLQHSWGDSTIIPLPTAVLSLQKDTGTLTIPLFQGILKYFLSPYRDYFYLPEEDNAIHKSVAQFVDPSFRRKATAATCYTKREGCFLPSLAKKTTDWDEPCFYQEHRAKPAFYQLHGTLSELQKEPVLRQLSQYLFYELPHF